MLVTVLQPTCDGGRGTSLCRPSTTVHVRFRWWSSYTCDFSCYNIKFHLLMPYVICVITHVPFLAPKASNEFIWNNFYPNVAKHLTKRVPKCALGRAIGLQCVGIKAVKSTIWGKKDSRFKRRGGTLGLGSPREEATPVPQSPCLPLPSL